MSRVPDAKLSAGLWVREGLNFNFLPHIILDEFIMAETHLELIEYMDNVRAEGRQWVVVLYAFGDDEVIRRRFHTLEAATECYWYSQNNMAAKLVTGGSFWLKDIMGEEGVDYGQPA